MDKQPKKYAAKWFTVAREGATVDGRTINRSWIEQCAKNYDPKKYGARVNLEHFKFRYLWKDEPHSLCYGDVLAVKTEEDDEGKLQLLAQIDPTPELVALNKQRQKIYTSVEIDTNFADTGEAYLVGLAVTDNPASLGTSMLKFTANTKDGEQTTEIVFGANIEQAMEFEELKPSFIERFKAKFAKQEQTQAEAKAETDKRFSEQEEALLTLAEECESLKTQLSESQTAFNQLQAQFEDIQTKFAKLESQEAKHYTPTPLATGENAPASGRFF